MIAKHISVENSHVLIMGLSFKENCPDIRNTRVIDLVDEFKSLKCNVDVYDPWVDKAQALKEFNINLLDLPIKNKYDAIILAVSHNDFRVLSEQDVRIYGKVNHILYDIKYIFKADEIDGRL